MEGRGRLTNNSPSNEGVDTAGEGVQDRHLLGTGGAAVDGGSGSPISLREVGTALLLALCMLALMVGCGSNPERRQVVVQSVAEELAVELEPELSELEAWVSDQHERFAPAVPAAHALLESLRTGGTLPPDARVGVLLVAFEEWLESRELEPDEVDRHVRRLRAGLALVRVAVAAEDSP